MYFVEKYFYMYSVDQFHIEQNFVFILVQFDIIFSA